jgi:Fe-S oxidoreductase
MPFLPNLRDRVPGLAWLSEKLAGLSAQRTLPVWRRAWREPFNPIKRKQPSVLLFADTFNRHFEPENLTAAFNVLRAAGESVLDASDGQGRPLCCGRTYLAAGMVDQARAEMQRTIDALRTYRPDMPVVGLEPSCVLTFRDEGPRLLDDWTEEDGRRIQLFEEFIADKDLPLKATAQRALLHGHCHQKAENVKGPVEVCLSKVPGLQVESIESSCCGMAGAFGYQAETIEVSKAMGELSLLPAVRAAGPGDLIVADGTSCRHQIWDGSGKDALHVARVLEMALDQG